ncbi:MAG: energy transducer TonB [Pyrinomonadaceae bacterium]|nr:energy transducer TonB [Pyrinomonadaceae bacterium]
MKTCTACEEEFEDKFSFCPVDGTPLNLLAAELAGFVMEERSSPTRQSSLLLRRHSQERSYEYQPTILSSAGLLERLARETRFLMDRLRQAWPELRSDPLAFAKLAAVDVANLLKQGFGAQGALSALTSLLLVLSVVLFVLRQGAATTTHPPSNDSDKASVKIITFADPSQIPSDTGVGTGTKGRVGFDRGKGEGSRPEPKRAQGGGSGGLDDELVAQKGRPPQPSEIPAPIPKLPPARTLALPVAGIDIDPALWKHLPFPVYGDPRSNSATPSNGPGDRGGMGDHSGTGIGEGKGDGFGPGSDGNTGGNSRQFGRGGPGGGLGNNPNGLEEPFRASQVGQRARVILKPEPQYTDEARKNQITGTVVLRVVFSRSGEVTNIRAVQSLPFGLTERAIVAARQIRFSPATKDGRPVSVYMQLEYNFNLY